MILANGCFDGLHGGHVSHLLQAKSMGRLIVALTSDGRVNKGDRRPYFSEQQRALVLRELRCVDEVIIVDSLTQALSAILPKVLVKGPDYSIDTIEPEHRALCERLGIEIRFTTGEKLSSTARYA